MPQAKRRGGMLGEGTSTGSPTATGLGSTVSHTGQSPDIPKGFQYTVEH